MRSFLRLFGITCFSLSILVGLVACGNKGPLYLPENEAPPVSMTPTTPPAAASQKEDETE